MNNEKFKIFMGRWMSTTLILWIMTFIGFVVINNTPNITQWNDIQRGNFGGFLIFFAVLTGIITAISVADNN